MNVPEIRLHVAYYLSRRDQAQCIRVSKEWYQTFIPFLWHTIHLPMTEKRHNHDEDGDGSYYYFKPDKDDYILPVSVPTAASIRNYGHHIQDMTMGLLCDLLPELLLSTTLHHQGTPSSLERLHLQTRSLIRDQKVLLPALRLLDQNPHLKNLSLACFMGPSAPDFIPWIGQARCRAHLKHLTLEFLQLQLSDLIDLLRNCPQLISMSLENCSFIERITGTTTLVPASEVVSPSPLQNEQEVEQEKIATFDSGLQTLSIKHSDFVSPSMVMQLVSHCSQLRTLIFGVDYDPDNPNGPNGRLHAPLGLYAPLSRCRNLSKIEIRFSESVRENEALEILKHCRVGILKSFDLVGTIMTTGSLEGLSLHFEFLTELHLSRCYVESWMILTVLSHCPRLVLFSCGDLNADYVGMVSSLGLPTNGKSINHALKDLYIYSLQWSTNLNKNKILMDLLASLTALEKLCIKKAFHHPLAVAPLQSQQPKPDDMQGEDDDHHRPQLGWTWS
ncbi:hypothetical protein BGZ83_006020 [Gryganskiella cystojenkinii]|nr:hypothetical protein BGZ83_006020 [Gryganskiella cystojenkinii]